MTLEENIAHWFALYVRPRHEKTVSRFLHANGWDTFLPLYIRRHVYTHRYKENELPLFPGYVFCRFNPFKRLPILATPGVLSIVGIGKRPVPLDDAEILAMQAAIHKQLTPQPCEFLQTGQRVRIMRGAMSGIEGVILESKNSLRLVLSITLLQRSVQFELDRSWVDICDPPLQLSMSPAPRLNTEIRSAGYLAGGGDCEDRNSCGRSRLATC
jgi:transcription antitermination factor NusG